MAKRFTDTDKWTKNKWFRKLPPEAKLFWTYLCDNCDHAGIWEVDLDFAELLIGMTIDQEKMLKLFGDRIKIIRDGKKWFLPTFLDFQYGPLDERNRVHASVIAILTREGANKGLIKPYQGRKDKDKDTPDSSPETEGEKRKKEEEKVRVENPLFFKFWEVYPKKQDRKKAIEAWKKYKCDDNFDFIMQQLRKFIDCPDWQKEAGKFAPMPTTWINGERWNDEVPQEKWKVSYRQRHPEEENQTGEE